MVSLILLRWLQAYASSYAHVYVRMHVCVCVCEFRTPAYAYIHNVFPRSPPDMTELMEMAVKTLFASLLQQQVCFKHPL